MTLLILGIAIAVIAFVYLTRATAPQGAPLGCYGLLAGIAIVVTAIVRLIFF
jgi:multidrug transporter EmrE-like cation transporter